MKKRTVSALGFGCMGISFAYGQPMEKQAAIALLAERAGR